MQSGVITGLLTGPNTLSRQLYLMGLIESGLCRKCGAEEETSVHVLCKCEALVTLRYHHLGSLFLDTEDVIHLSQGAIWNFIKGTGLPLLRIWFKGHKGPVTKD
jgi:hypothetical protein